MAGHTLPFIQQVGAAVAAYNAAHPGATRAAWASFSPAAAAQLSAAFGGVPVPERGGLMHAGKRHAKGQPLFGLAEGYWVDPEQQEPIVVGGADA